MKPQLAVAHCLCQPPLGLVLDAGPFVPLGIEHAALLSPRPLGRIHGLVSVAKQGFRVAKIAGKTVADAG